LWTYLKKRDIDVAEIMEKIKDLIIKTIIRFEEFLFSIKYLYQILVPIPILMFLQKQMFDENLVFMNYLVLMLFLMNNVNHI